MTHCCKRLIGVKEAEKGSHNQATTSQVRTQVLRRGENVVELSASLAWSVI